MRVVRESSIDNVREPGFEVLWRSRKSYLERYFKIPTRFSISKYHTYTFTSSKAGSFKAKKFSFFCEESMFPLLRREIPVEVISSEATFIFTSNEFKSSVTLLSAVASSQHATRRIYLLRNIIDKY